MNLHEYLRIARRWWWLVTLGCLLAGAAAWLLTAQMSPVYRARAVLLVNQAQNPASVTYQDILGSQQLTKTYAQLVTSTTNLDRYWPSWTTQGSRRRRSVRMSAQAR